VAAKGDVTGTGLGAGRSILVTGSPVNGAVLTVAQATATFTASFTPSFTATFTPSFTPTFTPSFTPTDTPSFTPSFTATITATYTATVMPPDHLAFVGAIPPMTAGQSAGPVTVEVRNAANQPATLLSAFTFNLNSDSSGEWRFSLTSGGGAVNQVIVPVGPPQAVVYLMEYKAGNWTWTASAPGVNSGTAPATVSPGPAVAIQWLWPGESPDPGRPIQNPTGKTGTVLPIQAGALVTGALRAVDAWFNLTTATVNQVNLQLTDGAAPTPSSSNILGGTGTAPTHFYTQGPQQGTARDSSNVLSPGTSSPIQVSAGVGSTLLRVVHLPTGLTTAIKGQVGIPLMGFSLNVAAGTFQIQPEAWTFHLEDASGNPAAFQSVISSITLTDGTQSQVLNVSAVSGSAATFIVLPGNFLCSDNPALPVTILGDVSPNAIDGSFRLGVLSVNDMVVKDASSNNGPLGIITTGDSTGFPMKSETLLIRSGNLADTYGNHPNPFRAGYESTTFEFYLASPGDAELSVFDITGRLVRHLASGPKAAGAQRILWDGKNGLGQTVSNGVYFAQLKAQGETHILKVAVAR